MSGRRKGETETDTETETETETGVETGTEAESETEAATETKTEVETGTGQHGGYQVTIAEEAKYNILLNHEDGRYDAGERVEFSGDVPDGSLTAVAALMLPANEAGDMADRLYAEVTYHAASGTYSFLMPEGDISLNVLMDTAEGSPIQPVPDGTGCWKDAVGIKAGTFMYITDGIFHPFDSVMGSGGNASYKTFGRVTVVHGKKGCGKSMFAAKLMAACTNRKYPEDMQEIAPGNVLYFSADDDLSDLVKPRLMQAGAELSVSMLAVWRMLQARSEECFVGGYGG